VPHGRADGRGSDTWLTYGEQKHHVHLTLAALTAARTDVDQTLSPE
jgi:hypothetical protein